MTEYCNPMECEAYASGWCEYDAIMDELYPMSPDVCPLMQKEGEG